MLYAGNGAGLTQENICGGADNKCYVTTRGDGNFKPDGTETEGVIRILSISPLSVQWIFSILSFCLSADGLYLSVGCDCSK